MIRKLHRGTRVCLLFSLRLEDGTEVDGTGDGEPWCFMLGDGSLVPVMEEAVASLGVGERKTFTFVPLDAYGFRDESLIHTLAEADFPPDVTATPGMVIAFATPGGEEIPGLILERQGDKVLVDFNHPLAGHTLVFEVQIASAQAVDILDTGG